jgi:hypothetical protein
MNGSAAGCRRRFAVSPVCARERKRRDCGMDLLHGEGALFYYFGICLAQAVFFFCSFRVA